MLDQNKIILENGIKYFDFTASGLGYVDIEDKIQEILKTYANTHSEVGHNTSITSLHYENARKSLKKSLGLTDDFFVIPCGSGSTMAIKKFQELMGIYIPPYTAERLNINKKNYNLPLVVVGPFEHHSNEISFREGMCETIRIPLKDGKTDLDYLEKILEENKDREIIGSFSAASNVTGILNPIKEIYNILKKYNAIVAFDCATSSPYINLDYNFFDALFLSPHKCIGGPGSCGLLVIRKSICEKNNPKPTFAGGGTVDYVSRVAQTYICNFEYREDAGTPGIIQFIKASLAYELRNKYGLEFIKQKEEELKEYFYEKIENKFDNLQLYSKKEQEKLPIFSINIDGISPYKIADILSTKFGIQTRAGCSCTGPYGHDLLDLPDGIVYDEKPGWLRISLHYLHEKKDIDYLIESLEETIKLLK